MMLIELQYSDGVYFLKRVGSNLTGGFIDVERGYYTSDYSLNNNNIARNNPKINLAPSELMEWNNGG